MEFSPGLALLGGVLLAGFLYFLYNEVQKSKDKKRGPGGGGNSDRDTKVK